jgi:hypothetical protein
MTQNNKKELFMRIKHWKSLLAGLFAAAVYASPSNAADPIGNFALLDVKGDFHQLNKYGYQDALVIVAQANGCVANYDDNFKYKLLETDYKTDNISYLMLNVAGESRDAVRQEAETFDYNWPVLIDSSQLVAESLGITKAGEIVIIDPQRMQILYRGPVQSGARSNDPVRMKIDAALDTALTGDTRSAETVAMAADGCDIAFPGKQMHASNTPDYVNDIAPILKEQCVACHRQGGIAPFAMDSHQMVMGWSTMMRETLMTKRMPPAQVDPDIKHFQNARYISDADLQTLVHWIDAGAPRGDSPGEPLAGLTFQEGWDLGEPDLVVYAEDFVVPATGVIDYRYPIIDLPFEEDVWVKAVQFVPQERSVVHHMIASIVEPQYSRELEAEERGEVRFLEGYAPGKEAATVFPEGTGVLIPKGYKIRLDSHYTTMGKEARDRTAIGIYLSDEVPEHEFRTYRLSHEGKNLVIPAGEMNHSMYASYTFDKEVTLFAFRPHMHTRGKDMRFKVIYPDHSSEDLINVANYNFNWQPTYRLTDPLVIPAGSRVVIDGAFDNSEFNPGASDPSVDSLGGLQTWDEMFAGYLTYTYNDEM